MILFPLPHWLFKNCLHPLKSQLLVPLHMPLIIQGFTASSLLCRQNYHELYTIITDLQCPENTLRAELNIKRTGRHLPGPAPVQLSSSTVKIELSEAQWTWTKNNTHSMSVSGVQREREEN